MSRIVRTSLLAGALVTLACRRTPAPPPLFEKLSPNVTGVRFANTLPEAPDFNILDYLYYYNGGGVAVGDVNGDGLPDLYFTSNLGPNKLYLNRGDYRFEDVTDRAGVADADGWKSGVTMADVNGDGRLDIFVSAVSVGPKRGHNALFINNGDGTFTDRAKEYGLDQDGYGTQALFLDYDGDGDLDVFLLRHSTHNETGAPKRDVRAEKGGGRLLRNDAGHFVDVSAKAGIYGGVEGFGLGVVATDVNGDGCPDLYVANDFQENDFLYVNNCDGTFTESIARSTTHTSRFAMGVDAADVNDDGRPDVFVADMLPEREDVLKTSASTESYSLFDLRVKAGYHPQYERNTLQLNRGTLGGVTRFSDVGFLAGVSATDWSWAPLFADLDNDGRKDLFVTSGVYRRPNDMDYIEYVGSEAMQAALATGDSMVKAALLHHMPQVPAPSHAFRNDGNLAFTDMAAAWGLGAPGFANGAVYADLDNDGALDLVVNNIGAPASIYHNRARAINHNAYLTVTLRGEGMNTQGIGAKLYVTQRGATQLYEQMPTRGFQSSVDPRLHVGLGRSPTIDSLVVVWPDLRFQVLTNVAGDRAITLAQRDARGHWAPPRDTTPPPFAAAPRLGIDFKHAENPFDDFDPEPLIPHRLSTEGPALAVGDVNGDGLDDVYVGGAKWQPGALFVQLPNGSFRASAQPAFAADSVAEDVDAALFDADGDGHPDLFVASGGNEFWGDADALRPRLYLNDGAGHFRRAADALPDVFENASCVVPGDFDGDGHVDVFVGGRSVSRKYGVTPQSHLLRNDGRGHFVDVTSTVAPALASVGMVTSAAWSDVDGDGKLDLVVVGEWMPVRVFRQEAGRLIDRTRESGLAGTEGWWNTVRAADLNGDGKPDLVLGNLGRNAYVTASPSEPARLYVRDFGHDGTLEQILTFYKHGTSYPIAGRDELLKVLPSLREKYPTYASFGASRVEDIFPSSELRQATVLEARTFSSAVALNDGRGAFRLTPLPVEAQIAPVYATLAEDFDGDGKVDLLLAGNFYGVPPIQGRYDASYGLLLHGLGDGRFAAVDMERGGLVLDGQVRRLRLLRRRMNGPQLVLAARNDDALQILEWRGGASSTIASGMPRTGGRRGRRGD